MKNEDFVKKARRLKAQFDKLNYPDKLKFMDENFGQDYKVETGQIEFKIAPSGISDKSGNLIISVYPDPGNKEQIFLYNERFIKINRGFKNDLFIDYSFDRLKQRFEKDIKSIRDKNPFPENIIRDFIKDELGIYSERVKLPLIQSEYRYYKGNWDLSKKVIGNTFLQAQAWFNYIGFLQSQLQNGITPGKKILKTFPEYLINIQDEKKELFAEGLKNQFNEGKGLTIRYMIEGLRNLNYLSIGDRERTSLFNAIEKYFNRDIGKREGVFTVKQPNADNIKSAEERILAVLNSIK